MGPVAFETSRLVLRGLEPADAPFIQRLVNEPDWVRNIGNAGVDSPEKALAYIERVRLTYTRPGMGLQRIELKRDGAPIGLAGLIRRETLDDVDVGFALLAEHRGRGYATEAAAAALAHGERALGLKRIVGITARDNTLSMRVLEKLGLGFERWIEFRPGEPASRLFAKPRVRLRPVESGDIPVLFRQQLDPEANRRAAFAAEDPHSFVSFAAHWTRILADARVDKRAILCADHLVGHLVAFDLGDERSIGYWIAREHWDRGIATAALRIYLAETPDRPLYARVVPDNSASVRVLEKCGFRPSRVGRAFAHGRSMEVDERVFVLER
jgi:RimJ/RimL family protein N-acetyltransferase